MYIYFIVSSIYLCYLCSFFPQVCRKHLSRKTIEELEEEDMIENEFDLLETEKIE